MAHRASLLVALLGIALGVPSSAPAAGVGVLDRPFGTDGISVLNGGTGGRAQVDQVYDAVRLPSGRIVVLGEDSVLHALTPGGRLDRRWGRDGRLDTVFGDQNQQEAQTLVARPDGGIHVLGTDVGGAPAVARIDARGNVVTSFGDNGTARRHVADYGFPLPIHIPYGPAVLSVSTAYDRILIAAFSSATGAPVRSFGRDGLLEVRRAADGPRVLRLARDGRFSLVTAMSGRNVPAGVETLRFGDDGIVTRSVLPFPAFRILDDGVGFVAVAGNTVLPLHEDGTPRGPAVAVPRMADVGAALRTPAAGLMLAGTIGFANGYNRLVVSRLTRAGAPDTGFWPGGSRMLSFPRARIGQRLGALVGPAGPGGLVTAVGTSGDGLNDIREDLGSTFLAALRIRTRPPLVSAATVTARVDRRGGAVVVLRCRGGRAACPPPAVVVRHGGRVLDRRPARTPRPGATARTLVRLGARGARIAGRRGTVQLDVIAGGDRVRTTVRLRRA